MGLEMVDQEVVKMNFVEKTNAQAR